MIYRDDDVGKYTDLTTIMKIQELFDRHQKIHTVTILMDELWESRGVWEWVITTPNLDVALHGWKHIDHSLMTPSDLNSMIGKCKDYWYSNLERIGCNKEFPKVFYPPWNKITQEGIYTVNKNGISVNVCVDPTRVFNFHWWEYIGGRNLNKLEERIKND